MFLINSVIALIGRFAMAGRSVRSAVGLCVVGFCRLRFSCCFSFKVSRQGLLAFC